MRARSRIFSAPSRPTDPRPALLSVISLLLLLLPLLLASSSATGLTSLVLEIPADGEGPPPVAEGLVEDLRVEELSEEEGFRLITRVRRTDVRAAEGEAELREEQFADLAALQAALRRLKGMDPRRERLVLAPHPKQTTEGVLRVMDAVAADGSGPLFGELVLEDAMGQP
jgi:hypothetical protein